MKNVLSRTAESLRDILLQWPAFNHGDRDALVNYLRELQKNNPDLNPRAVDMISRVLFMNTWQIRDVMVPHNDIVSLRTNDNYHAVVAVVCETEHSRYPVFEEDGEKVCGILHAKDLLGYVDKADSFNIRKVVRPLSVYPETKTLDSMLEDFLRSRQHMAVVVDEYEMPMGIITIEDVLERIVGEIRDEFDEDEDHSTDDGAIISGAMSVEEFNANFHAKLPEDKTDTIAGWLAAAVGKMPATGHVHLEHGFSFEVTEATERRIHSVRVSRLTSNQN